MDNRSEDRGTEERCQQLGHWQISGDMSQPLPALLSVHVPIVNIMNAPSERWTKALIVRR
jgi:hypothetical protein